MHEFNQCTGTEGKRVIYDTVKQGRRNREKHNIFLGKKKKKARDYQSTGNTKKDFFEEAVSLRFSEHVGALASSGSVPRRFHQKNATEWDHALKCSKSRTPMLQ
ncbi:hypothetical protein PRNP1_009284 [Phytophthora ramorum]